MTDDAPEEPTDFESPHAPAAPVKRRIAADGSEVERGESVSAEADDTDGVATPFAVGEGAVLPPTPPVNWRRVVPLILLVGGLVAAVFLWFAQARQEPTRLAEDFLQHLNEGQFEEAVAMTDPRCAGSFGVTEAEAIFAGRRIEYEMTDSNVRSEAADVEGDITIDGLGTGRVFLGLLEFDGDWKICSIQYK